MGNEGSIFLKAGTYFTADRACFNYGGEFLLTFEDTTKVIPIYGMSVTKGTGFQLKFGFYF